MVQNLSEYIHEKNHKKRLNLNVFDLIYKKKNEAVKNKLKMLKIAESKINEELDISYILNKLEEIEKLKLVLLNSEQIMLFDLIAKPIIRVNNNDQFSVNSPVIEILGRTKKIEETNDEKLNDLILYYNEAKYCKKHNGKDIRLMNLLDKDIRQYLDYK